MSEIEQEQSIEDNNEGILEVDLNPGAERIVTLSGQIVVDARDKPNSYGKHWTNRQEYDRMSTLYLAIRRAYEKGEDMNTALERAAKELGFTDIKGVRIIGGVPEHWQRK